MTRDLRIGLYGDVNLNVIDGSAIWLQSLASVLSRTKRASTLVVLKAAEERDILTGPLRDIPNVEVLSPLDSGRFDSEQLSTAQALQVFEELDAKEPFDAFIFRGFDLCYRAAIEKNKTFEGKLWAYITDFPQSPVDLTDRARTRLVAIAEASKFLLCQTEPLRAMFESYIPGAAGKAVLLPPMIPDEVPTTHVVADKARDEPLRLVYVGKFAPLWHTYEMTQVVASMRAQGVPVELHMVGDKIHHDRNDPSYHERMRTSLEQTPGVIWHGGKSSKETLALLPQFDVAMGWRHEDLDESLELSTKLLEYGAAGLPTIVNRNPMHERLLGSEYPLFASSEQDFRDAVIQARSSSLREAAAASCSDAVAPFRFSAAARSVDTYLDRAVPRLDLRRGQARPLRILVACHDFKFFTRIQEHLASIRGVELRVDAWEAINAHDLKHSQEMLEWADVIICEWCCNNAIWYSRNKREHQKLIIRLHRFELHRRYPSRVRFENVDHVVLVGDFYRDKAIRELGWDPNKLQVIPNWVDTMLLDRPKHPDALMNLGMVGIVPKLKRVDRGLNILEALLKIDSRFQLYIKTKMLWQYPWLWKDPEEQEHCREVMRRINSTAALQNAVHFDAFGPEVAAWFQKIGFVLSTSDLESFHLAAAEGMASGALPMLLNWPGIEAIYPQQWIHEDEDAVVETIMKNLETRRATQGGVEVKKYIEQMYSVERVCEQWESIVFSESQR